MWNGTSRTLDVALGELEVQNVWIGIKYVKHPIVMHFNKTGNKSHMSIFQIWTNKASIEAKSNRSVDFEISVFYIL